MVRDFRKDKAYFDKYLSVEESRFNEFYLIALEKSKENNNKAARKALTYAASFLRNKMIALYSSGAPLDDIKIVFEKWVDICAELPKLLKYDAPKNKNVGLPAYNWWNEGLHGIARAGVATMFPQAIGLAAMFDEETMFKAADIISTEARAKYNEFLKHGDRDIYKGLTLWSPNINIFRGQV